jgi:hypothetical protein
MINPIRMSPKPSPVIMERNHQVLGRSMSLMRGRIAIAVKIMPAMVK